MSAAENTVRDMAAALYDAIAKAEAIGLRVDFPKHLLPGIAVSETNKFVAEPAVEEFAASRRGKSQSFKIKD